MHPSPACIRPPINPGSPSSSDQSTGSAAQSFRSAPVESTPTSSRKRRSFDSEDDVQILSGEVSEHMKHHFNERVSMNHLSFDARTSTPSSYKRRRLTPPHSDTPSNSSSNIQKGLLTPISAQSQNRPILTKRLQLIIPSPPAPSAIAIRQVKHRNAAARRWQPKLQRPFPTKREIRDAYHLKLMRHYPSVHPRTEPDFIKPAIDKSPRVEKLLRKFPLLPNPKNSISPSWTGFANYHNIPVKSAEQQRLDNDYAKLAANKRITRSSRIRQLAWKNFSTREEGRVDRGREAMLESGLMTVDLEAENWGKPNKLPDWRKARTGRWAKESTRR